MNEVDFHACVIGGLRTYCSPHNLALVNVPADTWMKAVADQSEAANDNKRFQDALWDLAKQMAPEKRAKQRIGEVLEQSREMVVSQKHEIAETFMTTWVALTTDMLAQTGYRVEDSLPPANALRLFQALVTQGGLPTKLMRQQGISRSDLTSTGEALGPHMQTLMEAVANAIDMSYAQYQQPQQGKSNKDWSSKEWSSKDSSWSKKDSDWSKKDSDWSMPSPTMPAPFSSRVSAPVPTFPSAVGPMLTKAGSPAMPQIRATPLANPFTRPRVDSVHSRCQARLRVLDSSCLARLRIADSTRWVARCRVAGAIP